MSRKGKGKISVLHDNPPLPGKKFYLVSMISPESPQKHDTYGIKIHDMCETEEEGRDLCKYYHNLDPDFDVFLGAVGKWCPWVFNPLEVKNVEYANAQLTELVRSHRMNQSTGDREWRENVDKHLEEIQFAGTKEGQEQMAATKEPAVSFYFKIKQMEHTIKRRKEELDNLLEVFHTKYNKTERMEAKRAKLPQFTEPSPMHYTEYKQEEKSSDNVVKQEERPLQPPSTDKGKIKPRNIEMSSSDSDVFHSAQSHQTSSSSEKKYASSSSS